MRKLVFQEFLSVDGYAADKNNSTGFFESPVFSKDSDDDLLQEMNRFDAILLGANTYRMFADFWPQATNEEQIVADKLNSIPKFVFSNTLQEAPWGNWPAATIMKGDAVNNIAEFKKQEGKDMVLWGSISLAQDLIRANLIDEYQFRIVPVLLGAGRLLFADSPEIKLRLTNTKNYDSGLVLAEYFSEQNS